MPGLVPSKQSTHTVNKNAGKFHQGGQLNFALPAPISSRQASLNFQDQSTHLLPSWRFSQPDSIWEGVTQPQQGFPQGLAFADNATAIKGLRAQACLPPLNTNLARGAVSKRDSANLSLVWDIVPNMDVEHHHSSYAPKFGRGAFQPVQEHQYANPGLGHDSSPMVPSTPFGEFVDRAVAAGQQPSVVYNLPVGTIDTSDIAHGQLPEEPMPTPAGPSDIAAPCATASYKKLAEPLSVWVSNHIWRTCTMPPGYDNPTGAGNRHSSMPPSHLAPSIHSLLLSTLLQPSAVFLALWYIGRLPVYFGGPTLECDLEKQLRFRSILLGDEHTLDRETLEANAPFRLAVLGCMLANKWLDDHTFSNTTWHTISNVPVHTLNRLESLALDIYSYDLSISSAQWSRWLSDLTIYHSSLTSPSFPQPISRPSSNPHSIVRKAIEDILQARTVFDTKDSSQPIFLGLNERRAERHQLLSVTEHSVSDIDLDEDGPLRREYLPRRKPTIVKDLAPQHDENSWPGRIPDGAKKLPPPAKWSPAADEPILRNSNRGALPYVAVQPPVSYPVQAMPPFANPDSYKRNAGPWHAPPMVGYMYDMSAPSLHLPPPPMPAGPAFHGQILQPVAPQNHSRSMSMSGYVPMHEASQQQNHGRSYSQSARYDQNFPPPQDPPSGQTRWGAGGPYEFLYPSAVHAFTSYCGFNAANCFQPTWLRA